MVKETVRFCRIGRRGMTVFVVMMVITMLGAVGLFAARAATLGVNNAGRYRQMVQTHYIAEAGMQGAVSEFARDPSGYLVRLRNSPSPTSMPTSPGGALPCQDIPTSTPSFTPASTVCLRMGYSAIESAAHVRDPANSAFKLFMPKGVSTVTGGPTPGSFGIANIAGNFTVEFTDERPIEPPPAGMPISGGGGSTMKFRAITARAVGEVIPTDDDGNILATTDPTAAKYATSLETIRAEIVVGPVP